MSMNPNEPRKTRQEIFEERARRQERLAEMARRQGELYDKKRERFQDNARRQEEIYNQKQEKRVQRHVNVNALARKIQKANKNGIPTGPIRAKNEIQKAFDQARDERIKKKVADRRRMNGSGGSHGF